jgi:hypothetical protein
VLLTMTLAAAGCTTIVSPPRDVADPVPVYLTDYGRHSSIIVRAPDGLMTEYTYGDWNWLALNHNTFTDAVQAMVHSPASTLGRRRFDVRDDINEIGYITGASKVTRLEVSRAEVERLIDDLDSAYYARRRTLTYNARSTMWFVRTPERYNAGHNCNHVTSRWLNQLGCDTRGTEAFSKFVVRER